MSLEEKMVYFDLRGRGESIRMLYALADKELNEERHQIDENWPTLLTKLQPPLGQLPTFTAHQVVLCHSNVISRYVAKKFGLVGEGLWSETLNDVIVETLHEYVNNLIAKVILWKVLKLRPEPEDSEKVTEKLKEDFMKGLAYVKSIGEKNGGHNFLLGDKIQLADVWLYTTLEFSKPAFSDAMEITPWVKDFVDKFEADPRMKKHIENRPEAYI